MAKTGTNIKNYDNSPDMGNVDYVVEWQKPTERNGYTWYRLYASGWIIQGGHIGDTSGQGGTVNLVYPMPNNKYNIFIQPFNSGDRSVIYTTVTTTSFTYSGNVGKDSWLVLGYAV